MSYFIYFSDNGINSRLLPTNCLSVFDHFVGACNFIKKEVLAHVFSCEFCEKSKNYFLTEHLQWLLLPRAFYGDLNEIIGTGASSSLLRLLNRDLKLLRCLVLFLFPMLVLVQSFFKPMVVCNDKNKQIKSNKSKYQNTIYQITAHMNKFTDKFTNLLMKWPP